MTHQIHYIDATIPSGDDGTLAKKHLISHLRPDWNPEKIVTKIVTGGYNNVTVRFHHEEDEERKDALIMRCYKEQFNLEWLSHGQDLATMQLAHHAGCFGPIYATFNNGIVYKFAPGRNLTEAEMTDPKIARLLARCLAQFHSADVEKIPIVDRFGKPAAFPRVKFYEQFCNQLDNFLEVDFNPEDKARVQGLRPKFEEWKREMLSMVSVYEELGVTQAFCHHDAHARNIVYNKQTGDLSLIDFEAGKFGFAAHDLSYMFNLYIHTQFIKPRAEGDEGFPFSKGPVPRELRLVYARSYLERKYELQGRDAGCLKQEEIEAWLIEIQLIDIIMPLVLVMMQTCVHWSIDYALCIFEPFTKMYYERKSNLKHLQREYRRLESAPRS